MGKSIDSRGPITRQGARFCGRLCGRGCTKREYETAERLAAKLVARLGKGWLPHVWENLGWHYKAIRGVVTVHAEPLTFAMSVNPPPPISARRMCSA